MRISKKSLNLIIRYNLEKICYRLLIYIYIYTKYNDIFKFTISLKLNEELAFLGVSPKTGLFSIARFLYGWQKIFTNKNIFSTGGPHVFFITFFFKMYNKKQFFMPLFPLISRYLKIIFLNSDTFWKKNEFSLIKLYLQNIY